MFFYGRYNLINIKVIRPRFFYKIFLLMVFVFILVPAITQAQVNDKLKYCWKSEECLNGEITSDGCTHYSEITKTNYCFKSDAEYCGKEGGLGRCYVKPSKIHLQVDIPAIAGNDTLSSVDSFPVYLKYIYSFFVAIIGVVSVAYIAFGGYQWIIAAGSSEQISQAKSTIQGALIGLLLAVGSYFILNLINSRLVNLDNLKVERIKPVSLMTFCNDDSLISIRDWVPNADINATPISNDETVCGVEYISQSKPAQACLGTVCSDATRNTCLPYAGGYACGSLAEARQLCKQQVEKDEDLGKCIAVDKFYEKARIPLVCTIGLDLLNYAAISAVNQQLGDGTGNLASFLVGLFSGSSSTLECKAYDLVYEPWGTGPYGTFYTKRINCTDGAPLCYDIQTSKSKERCVNESSFPRIGRGQLQMCLEISTSTPSNVAYKCSSYQPVCTATPAYGTLGLSACDYVEVLQSACSGCSDKCWKFIGLYGDE